MGANHGTINSYYKTTSVFHTSKKFLPILLCRPTPVHSGPPIVPVRVASHQIIAATGALHGTLLHQGSLPTREKPSRRPNNPPRPSAMPYPRLSFTQTNQSSHPASSREDPSGLPYRSASTPPTRPQLSLRTPTPILPYRRPSGAAKEIHIAHNQQTVKTRHPVRPPTQTVTSCQWKVLDGVTETQIMSSWSKNHPRARPTNQNLRDTPANWRK